MIDFHNTQFIKSAVLPKDYPTVKDDRGHHLPEILFVGRSNVGKSSLLNNLCRKKGLAMVSKTPGKTQLLNFFCVDKKISLVDSPGYGYAAVPQATKKSWESMMTSYFQGREELKLVLFLVDIRRNPSEEDMQLVSWIRKFGRPLILILTKVDQLRPHEREPSAKAILQPLAGYIGDGAPSEETLYVYYSVKDNIGRNQLINTILSLVSAPHGTH